MSRLLVPSLNKLSRSENKLSLSTLKDMHKVSLTVITALECRHTDMQGMCVCDTPVDALACMHMCVVLCLYAVCVRQSACMCVRR